MGTPGSKRHTRWLWVLLPVVIVLVFNKLVVSILTLWQQASGGIPPGVFFYLPFLSVLPPLVLLSIWCLRPDRGLDPQLRLARRATWAADLGTGAAVGLLCVAVFVGSLKLQRSLGLDSQSLASLGLAHHLFFSTIGALIPGISEELYFRGFLMARFRDLSPTLVIGVTSLSFSLWHVLSPSYLPHTFVMGLLLGFTVHRTQRILPAILAHSLANASAGVLLVKGWV